MVNFWKGRHVVVTGAYGFVGNHLCARLEELGCDLFMPHSYDFDLRDIRQVNAMLSVASKGKPKSIDVIFNLAANVGGIGYNQAHPYNLFYDNIQIGVNIIDASVRRDVKKFIQVGTVCAYPKFAPVPFDERCLWDGYPEETNAPYGIAKRVTLTQLQAARQEYGFNGIYVLPTNLYGVGDTFNPEQSHVIPALIKKFCDAMEVKQGDKPYDVEVWGSGDASRDFLYVTDAVEGLLLLAEKYDRPEPVNLGSGEEIRIGVLVKLISDLTGFCGKIRWDRTKPDGQPRRVLRIWKAKELGWSPKVKLKEGLAKTIEFYKSQYT